jgi:ABC-2 type transport system ATP-binding protein
MSRGRLLVQGTVADLAARAQGRLVVRTGDVASAGEVLEKHGVTDVRRGEGQVDGAFEGGEQELAGLCAALVGAGVRVHGFGMERGTLEDAFVALTGEGFDVAG